MRCRSQVNGREHDLQCPQNAHRGEALGLAATRRLEFPIVSKDLQELYHFGSFQDGRIRTATMSSNPAESDVDAAYEAAKQLEWFVRMLKYISTTPDVPDTERRDAFDTCLNLLTEEFDVAWPALELVLPVLQSPQMARFGFGVHPSMHVAIANCVDHIRRKPSQPDAYEPARNGFIKIVGAMDLPAVDETDAQLWNERQATVAMLRVSTAARTDRPPDDAIHSQGAESTRGDVPAKQNGVLSSTVTNDVAADEFREAVQRVNVVKIAMDLFEWGCERLELDASQRGASRKVFNWLVSEAELPSGIDKPIWWTDRNYETFSSYLTKARRMSGQQLYDRKSGIETRSVKRHSNLDRPLADD